MNRIVTTGTMLLLCGTACTNNAPAPGATAEYERQLAASRQQIEDQQRQTEESDRLLKQAKEQNDRFDALLDTWEEQARRYDAILTRWERLDPPVVPADDPPGGTEP